MRLLKTHHAVKALTFGAAIAIATVAGATQIARAEPAASAPATGNVYEPMKPFLPYINKTWRGVGKDEKGKEIIDIQRWQLILGGRAVETSHGMEDGSYGGRTIIFFDEGKKTYIYHYFTTAGFHTQGTMKIEGDKIVSSEIVSGHATIAQVDATMTMADGKMTTASEYISKDGTRAPGHGFVYVEAPGAKVPF